MHLFKSAVPKVQNVKNNPMIGHKFFSEPSPDRTHNFTRFKFW